MAYDNPTITDFKDYFVRDFPFRNDVFFILSSVNI